MLQYFCFSSHGYYSVFDLAPGAVSLTGETIQRIKIPLVATSGGPNAVALAAQCWSWMGEHAPTTFSRL